MSQLDALAFEMPRRVVRLSPLTILPNGNPMNYMKNPNDAIDGSTEGDSLVYNSPVGTFFQMGDGTYWFKKTTPNTWIGIGSGDPLNIILNHGVVKLPTITNNGDGTITLSDESIINYLVGGVLVQRTKTNNDTLVMVDGSVTYVFSDYNNNNQTLTLTTSPVILETDYEKVPICRVVRNGNDLNILNYDEPGVVPETKSLYKDVVLNGVQRFTGLTLSTSGTRVSKITGGGVYFGYKRLMLSENESGVSGSLFHIFPVGGVYSREAVTSYDNSYYSDGINRLNLGNNDYVAKYFYICADENENKAFYFSGNKYNKIADAVAEPLPTIPNIFTANAVYVGKIVIREGELNGIAYPRTWGTGVVVSGAVNHNDLNDRDVAGNHSKLIPLTNTTTAIQITKADGTTPLLTFDTLNDKLVVPSTYVPTLPDHLIDKKYYEQNITLPIKEVSETKTIGVDGDYGNINDALVYADSFVWSGDSKLTLLIKSGHVITYQVRCINKNYGFVIISSEDAEVLVNPTTWVSSDSAGRKTLFHCETSTSPRINTIFVIDVPYRSITNTAGIIGLSNSSIIIQPNGGFSYFSERGMGGDVSTFTALGSIFQNNRNGVQVNQSSFNLNDAIISGSTNRSIVVTNGNGTLRRTLIENDLAGCTFQNAVIFSVDMVMNNIGTVNVTNSVMSFNGATITDINTNDGLFILGSTVVLNNTIILNTTTTNRTFGIRAVNSIFGTNDSSSTLDINGRFSSHMRLSGCYFNHMGTIDMNLINDNGNVNLNINGGDVNIRSCRLSQPHTFTITNGAKVTINAIKKPDGVLYTKEELNLPFTPNRVTSNGVIFSNLFLDSGAHNALDNRDVAGNHSKLIPLTNTTTAIQITKADGTTSILNVDSVNDRVGVNTTTPRSRLDVGGGVRVANDTDDPSVDKAGTLRYRTTLNSSHVDMCMQINATTYEWVNIITYTW